MAKSSVHERKRTRQGAEVQEGEGQWYSSSKELRYRREKGKGTAAARS
jgi:hypothetical protein